MIYTSGQPTVSVNTKIVNMLVSMGHMVSLATSQLYFIRKTATDSLYTCVPILLYLQNQAPLIYTMSIILVILQLNLSSSTGTRQWLWSSFLTGVYLCLCNPATSKPVYFFLKSILYSEPWYLGIFFFYWSIVALQYCIVSTVQQNLSHSYSLN